MVGEYAEAEWPLLLFSTDFSDFTLANFMLAAFLFCLVCNEVTEVSLCKDTSIVRVRLCIIGAFYRRRRDLCVCVQSEWRRLKGLCCDHGIMGVLEVCYTATPPKLKTRANLGVY